MKIGEYGVRTIGQRHPRNMQAAHRRPRSALARALLCGCIAGVGCGCARDVSRSGEGFGDQVIEEFHPNGKLKCRTEAKTRPDGTQVRHGMSRWWDESGVLIGQCHYVDGVKQGTEIKWFIEPAGAITKITQYYNGEENGPYINFDDRGCIVSVGYLVDNKMSGEWTYWYPMQSMGERRGYGGGRMARFYCVADEKEGPWVAWHWNGAKEQEGSYRLGKRHGTWRYWNEDGDLERTELWEDGKLIATKSPSSKPAENLHQP